jgi:hypothetical protein
MFIVFLRGRRSVGVRTRILMAALLGLTAAACDGAHALVAPPHDALASAAPVASLAARTVDESLAPLLDDVLERLVPALGDSRGATDVQQAFAALRAALPAGGVPDGDVARLATGLPAARAALARIADDAKLSPERDALALALEVVEDRIDSRR